MSCTCRVGQRLHERGGRSLGVGLWRHVGTPSIPHTYSHSLNSQLPLLLMFYVQSNANSVVLSVLTDDDDRSGAQEGVACPGQTCLVRVVFVLWLCVGHFLESSFPYL